MECTNSPSESYYENIINDSKNDSVNLNSTCDMNEVSSDVENYVCDISMMKIRDGDDMKETSTEEDFSLARLYINDVEVDRNEEEQTLTELVSASAHAEGMLER